MGQSGQKASHVHGAKDVEDLTARLSKSKMPGSSDLGSREEDPGFHDVVNEVPPELLGGGGGISFPHQTYFIQKEGAELSLRNRNVLGERRRGNCQDRSWSMHGSGGARGRRQVRSIRVRASEQSWGWRN